MISETAGPLLKMQTPIDDPGRELSNEGIKFDLEVIDDVTGQVNFKMFDHSDLVGLARKIARLGENKANNSV